MMQKALSKRVRSLKKRFKKACLFLFSYLFRSSCYSLFGVPSGLDKTKGNIDEIYPAAKETFPPPLTISSNPLQCFCEEQFDTGDGILSLKNAIATKMGGNLSEKGKLVTAYLQPLEGKLPHEHALFNFSAKRFFPKIFETKHPVVTLAAGWQNAFYHWMYEVLPRFHLIEKRGFDRHFLFLERSLDFQKESLDLLDTSPERVINCSEFEAVKTPLLIIPSINGRPTQWGCEFLRTRFLPKLGKEKKKYIYVSRGDATRRRVVNEEEVFQSLEPYGFEKVFLSSLPLKKQMEIFYNADVIIGPHGAGFSHLVFCDPQTKILEFFSPSYVNPCYWHVSCRVSLSYHYLLGEERNELSKLNPQDPDIFIDPEKLKKSLALMSIC